MYFYIFKKKVGCVTKKYFDNKNKKVANHSLTYNCSWQFSNSNIGANFVKQNIYCFVLDILKLTGKRI